MDEEIITIKGLDYQDGKFTQPIPIQFKLQNGVPGQGMPITARAARQMIGKYIQFKVANNLLDDNAAISFGRETILRILSQQDCEGIRFYFCYNHVDEESIVAVGIDINGDDIGSPTESGTILDLNSSEFTVCNEVGGPSKIRELSFFSEINRFM